MSQETGEGGFAPPSTSPQSAGPQPNQQQPGPYPRPYGQQPGQAPPLPPAYGQPGQPGQPGGPPYAQQPYGPGQHQPHQPYGYPQYGHPGGWQQQPQIDPTLAKWWQRLVARIVDGLVLGVLTAPLWIWFILWYVDRLPTLISTDPVTTQAELNEMLQVQLQLLGFSLLVGGLQAVVAFFYDWIMHARWGQTIGKRIMKIKVVRVTDRGPVPRGAAAKRSAAYALAPQVPLVGGPFALVNTLWLLWDKPHRQCLHDKWAQTIVIKAEPTEPKV